MNEKEVLKAARLLELRDAVDKMIEEIAGLSDDDLHQVEVRVDVRVGVRALGGFICDAKTSVAMLDDLHDSAMDQLDEMGIDDGTTPKVTVTVIPVDPFGPLERMILGGLLGASKIAGSAEPIVGGEKPEKSTSISDFIVALKAGAKRDGMRFGPIGG